VFTITSTRPNTGTRTRTRVSVNTALWIVTTLSARRSLFVYYITFKVCFKLYRELQTWC